MKGEASLPTSRAGIVLDNDCNIVKSDEPDCQGK